MMRKAQGAGIGASCDNPARRGPWSAARKHNLSRNWCRHHDGKGGGHRPAPVYLCVRGLRHRARRPDYGEGFWKDRPNGWLRGAGLLAESRYETFRL